MRTHTAFAAVLLAVTSFLPMTTSAEGEPSATLRVTVTDAAQAPVPGATVTIYTVDGNPGVTVTADGKGIATFARVTSGLTQVVATSRDLGFFAEATRLEPGLNQYHVTLPGPGEDDVTTSSEPSSYYVVVNASR